MSVEDIKEEWYNKHIEELLNAVEYHAVVMGDKLIRRVIDKIYEDGYADGYVDGQDECEERPMNIRAMMQDLD